MIIQDHTLIDIKSAVEKELGYRCSVRQQLANPYCFEITFDPEEK